MRFLSVVLIVTYAPSIQRRREGRRRPDDVRTATASPESAATATCGDACSGVEPGIGGDCDGDAQSWPVMSLESAVAATR
ncbi:hypothetical protein, partial [Thermophilibacter mediterraneus]|uniref:hypothetical protein n=1 Tax=Thermophilibacter mediterraneus TaxID=1871031 RepID=UPI00235292C7